MRIALVTARYGGYDDVAPLLPQHRFDDAVLVTDEPMPAPRGWRVVVEPSPLEPRLAAKRAKCLPWEYARADASVWVDASMAVVGPLRDAAAIRLRSSPLTVIRHPDAGWRRDAMDEAGFSAGMAKYRRFPVREQAAAYAAEGLPPGSGLWALGVMVRLHDARQRALGEHWLAEILRWSPQDQVSFPYSCWKAGVTSAAWDIDLYANHLWRFRPHLGSDR